MEKKDAILRINDWENRRKGLIYAGLVVGTIGLAAGLNLVGIIPTIPGTEESSKTVFETCLAAEIPILGIRQGIEANANIIRKIIGKDKKIETFQTKILMKIVQYTK